MQSLRVCMQRLKSKTLKTIKIVNQKIMQTKTLKNKTVQFFSVIMLVLGIGWSNVASACTVNFSYTTGVNGQVFFTSSISGYGPYPQYKWTLGDGSPNQYTVNASHQYLANGVYN